MTRFYRRLPVIALLLVAVLGAGCASPLGQEEVGEGASERPLGAEQPDPRRDALIAAATGLRESLAQARGHLATAMEAGDGSAAREAGGDAVAALLADDTAAADDEVLPVFPADSPDRAAATDETDALTVTVTAARDAGSIGSDVLDVLRDPLAGDLGAWQRDAAGMVAMVQEAIRSTSELGGLEEAVLQLSGEGTRALAWALLTADAGSADDAAAYAERGGAHLDIVLQALDTALAELADEGGSQ